ncbi:hypothetical protein CXG81DRAFT_14600, partial [Caulochytrium protostelioides]
MDTFVKVKSSLAGHEISKVREVSQKEKELARSAKKLARDTQRAGRQLQVWGTTEHPDLADIADKLGTLYEDLFVAQDYYADQHEAYRHFLKEIRNAEEAYYAVAKRQRLLQDRVEGLKKKNKPFEEVRLELLSVEGQLSKMEADLHENKRNLLRKGLTIQYEAMAVWAKRLALASRYGMHLVGQIPHDKPVQGHALPPWTHGHVVSRIMSDYHKEKQILKQQAP